MRQTKFALTWLTVSILAACGGSSPGDQTPKNKFSAQVSFGDSLSDVGTYAVGPVKALGGGKFTINGDNTALDPALTGKNWTELMAAQFGLPAPCAAQTGLDGDVAKGFSVQIEDHAGCYGYAQGGARVTEAVGLGNKALSPLGALTVPIALQIQHHLTAVGGAFKGDEIVFVMAGGGDALFLLAQLATGVQAAGAAAAADYAAAHGPDLVSAMATAGAELVTQVKAQILAKGANRVSVNNLPDIATTPFGLVQDAATQALIRAMVAAFNDQLNHGFAGESRVLVVDVFAASHDQAINPGPYGLTNVSETACDLSPAQNPLGNALGCNGRNLKSGNVSHYAFADDVHPTPFNNLLLARYISEKLVAKGWL